MSKGIKIGVGAGVLALLLGIGFFFGYVLNIGSIMYSFFLNNVWRSWLFPGGWNLLHATPLFWILLITGVVFITIVLMTNNWSSRRETAFFYTGVGVSVISVLSLLSFGFMWPAWNNSFYNESNVYKVESLDNIPNSLQRVISSDKRQVNVEEGVMPTGWENRSASATGAAYVMQKTGDTIQNTVLLPETISYVDGDWTAIRNGVKRENIYGVATWSGTGERVNTCTFTGDNRIDKAFNGVNGKNLENSIKAFAPTFIWSMKDVYGYCDGNDPIIVIPGAKLVPNRVQTAIVPAGVITVRGSATGKPVFEWIENVESGEIPGGVYPKNVLDKQRKALPWSGGRVWPWSIPVGFSSTGEFEGTQKGNNEDFLLRSKDDGHLYWVTLMKPRNAESETISAYSVTRADTVKNGELNENVVYVLNDDDQDIVNFNDLENAVIQAVSKADPGFFTGNEDNRGSIVEFLPTNSGEWRVFAERGGRAVYEINVSGGSLLKTSLKGLNNEDNNIIDPIVEDSNAYDNESDLCYKPETLSDRELIECINTFSEELSSRYNDHDKVEEAEEK